MIRERFPRVLTSGTTWHAAGLVGQLRASHNMTRLAGYSGDLYEQLDADGYPTGLKRTGSIAVANNEERLEELIRGADMAECFGIEVNPVSVEDLSAHWPLMNVDDVIGGVHVPRDAQTSPVDTTIALSKAAKANGARIIQGIDVADIVTAPTQGGRTATGAAYRAQGSTDELQTIEAEHVVTTAGLWSRHLVGFFEPVAKPIDATELPNTPFVHLPDDWDHLAPVIEKAIHRMPVIGEIGIRLFFRGIRVRCCP